MSRKLVFLLLNLILLASAVYAAAVDFTGTFSDSGRDTDSDGKFNYLDLTVNVNVNTAGEYDFYAILDKDDANFIEARKSLGESVHWYLAKTSFTLFGHSSSKRKYVKPILSNEINRPLEIYISPRFHYWPQTGNPVKITPLFNKDYLARKVVCLFDENMPSMDIMTDEKGNYTYVPPEDKKLNWKGETAFKQAVIVAEETKGDIKYISSYTLLLHRSRFKNRKLLMGVVIFLGTMIGVFLLVIVKRKRLNFETL